MEAGARALDRGWTPGWKRSIASAIAAWAAAGTDYRPLLRPGEAATVMCLAVDRDQAKQGVVYEPSDKVKSEIYLTCLPLLNSGLVDLLDDKRLIAQLCGLERRTARGGRDSIDHAPGAHDDVANSCCGALVRAMAKAPMRIHPSVVERAGWPARPPLIAW